MAFNNFTFMNYTKHIQVTKISTDSYFLHLSINLKCSRGRYLESNTLQSSPLLGLPASLSQAPTSALHFIAPATLWLCAFRSVGVSWQGKEGILHFAFSCTTALKPGWQQYCGEAIFQTSKPLSVPSFCNCWQSSLLCVLLLQA